jgi:methyl-accepting chemotaxis protein
MKLRSQFLLTACATALACGGIGTYLIGQQVSRGASELLDGELRVGESALQRQWALRRAAKRGVYQGVANQTYLRAYLLAHDREQMSYFAEAARRAGANDAVIVDAEGKELARSGDHAEALLAASSKREISPDGALVVLDGALADAYRVPVGGDRTVGWLVAANRVDEAALKADAEPFGVSVAVTFEGAFATTLAPEFTEEARVLLKGNQGAGELGSGDDRLQVRVSPFDGGRLLVAAPTKQISTLTAEARRLLAALIGLVLVVSVGGALIVLGRVAHPISRLKTSAEQLAAGDLEDSAAALGVLRDRRDEFGALALAFVDAARRLSEIVATTAHLSKALESAVNAVDRSAESVALGAARQEQRLGEVGAIFDPLMHSQERAQNGLAEVRSAARSAAGTLTSMERVVARAEAAFARVSATLDSMERLPNDGAQARMQALRLATDGSEQLGAGSALLREQRDTMSRLAEEIGALRTRIEESTTIHLAERSRSSFAVRALAEIGRVANGHVREVTALRGSAEKLRRDLARLRETIDFFAAVPVQRDE